MAACRTKWFYFPPAKKYGGKSKGKRINKRQAIKLMKKWDMSDAWIRHEVETVCHVGANNIIHDDPRKPTAETLVGIRDAGKNRN